MCLRREWGNITDKTFCDEKTKVGERGDKKHKVRSEGNRCHWHKLRHKMSVCLFTFTTNYP